MGIYKFPSTFFAQRLSRQQFHFNGAGALGQAFVCEKLCPCCSFHLAHSFHYTRLTRTLVLHPETLFLQIGNKKDPAQKPFTCLNTDYFRRNIPAEFCTFFQILSRQNSRTTHNNKTVKKQWHMHSNKKLSSINTDTAFLLLPALSPQTVCLPCSSSPSSLQILFFIFPVAVIHLLCVHSSTNWRRHLLKVFLCEDSTTWKPSDKLRRLT